jgi:hypothetical protein
MKKNTINNSQYHYHHYPNTDSAANYIGGILQMDNPASEMPMGFFDENTKIFKHETNSNGVYTIGKFSQIRAKWVTNNEGWTFPVDYQKDKMKKRIAVIGDSYIEALQVDQDRSYPYLLSKRLGKDYEVYTFGKRGSCSFTIS